MSDALADLSRSGVSVWLDDLSRELLAGGELARLIRDRHVVGVTTNPTIFASALAKGDRYTDQVRALAARGADVEQAVFEITTDDVRAGADALRPVYDATDGLDGRVSIEVDPRLARDGERTIAAARQLWATVDRPNTMIKIPATVEGLPAITTALSEGISVNVTLIFSLPRYRAVMNAYLEGLEQARAAGHDPHRISSVASFFVSRVDTEVDRRLDGIGTDEARALKGKAAIANARLAYQAYEEVFSTARWQVLADAGARPQRPLWASTGVKDPDYPDTMYVSELVAPNTVNTMPGKTLDAVADHGEITGDTVRGRYDEATGVLDALSRLGIGYADVVDLLEREGVDKFEKSWADLLTTVDDELARAAVSTSAEEADR
jgi:transaldolase